MTENVSGFCRRKHHADCNGVLSTSTGFHWWCACKCHPEPDVTSVAANARKDAVKAKATWQSARRWARGRVVVPSPTEDA